MATVRICVCGDEGTGKTSLITALVKDTFAASRLQAVLPPITLPNAQLPDAASTSSWRPPTTILVDTSAQPHERDALRIELRKANVILLVYSDHYTFERVALFWLPFFRSLGVNVPVVLCTSKADIHLQSGTEFEAEEMLGLMNEFKEIDSCIRTSAKDHSNITEAFFLCQKAVTHPIAPLYDSKEAALKPAAVAALRRIFYLCDKDRDGALDDDELQAFQTKCFGKRLEDAELQDIKRQISAHQSHASVHDLDVNGFLQLNKIFAEKGRHETIWTILRTFHYTDSLSLQESFLHPALLVPQYASAELAPQGYRFLVDLFLLHDKDNDGGLNTSELDALFAPTPGLPASWVDSAFPSCAMRNEAGYITLQGWLAQWSMTTFEEPNTTLEYLAYLGFEAATSRDGGTTAALRITRARKNRARTLRVERNVFLCYVLGGPGSGKTSLLDAFLGKPFLQTHAPTIKQRTAVNTVELPGGKQVYMILSELAEVETAILENQTRLDACDLLCYTYDSSDPDSFAHITELRTRHPALNAIPAVYVALKADLDKTMQRQDVQPDEYCEQRRMALPLHVSVTWSSIQNLFAHLAECATFPSRALPTRDDEPADRTPLYMAAGAAVAAFVAAVIVWKKSIASAND